MYKYRITNNFGKDVNGVRAVYTSVCFLREVNLWSGDETDPVGWAYMGADSVAVDEMGRALPYDVTVSFFGLNFDRGVEMIEFEDRDRCRLMQSVAVHLVVFKDLASYVEYVESGNCLIHQD